MVASKGEKMARMGAVGDFSRWTSQREGGGASWLRGELFVFLCFLHSGNSRKVGEKERGRSFLWIWGSRGGICERGVLGKAGTREEGQEERESSLDDGFFFDF